jgi:hypothetical protein
MKRIAYVGILVGSLVSLADAQSGSLGDYARAVRKENKTVATKKFDNDNLPRTDKLSVVGAVPSEAEQAQATMPTDQALNGTQTQPVPVASKPNPEEWKGKIAEQKSKLDLLSRELDVAEREYRLRAAAMYGDVGARLRNQGAWDKEDADYKKQLADKQQALDNAKQSLDEMQEQARKAGVPAGDRK